MLSIAASAEVRPRLLYRLTDLEFGLVAQLARAHA